VVWSQADIVHFFAGSKVDVCVADILPDYVDCGQGQDVDGVFILFEDLGDSQMSLNVIGMARYASLIKSDDVVDLLVELFPCEVLADLLCDNLRLPMRLHSILQKWVVEDLRVCES